MSAPTQVARPWRSSIRTAVQLALALATLVPFVVTGIYGSADAAPVAVAQVLGAATTFARIMALPAVETFLATWLPWLAADPDSAWKADSDQAAAAPAYHPGGYIASPQADDAARVEAETREDPLPPAA